MDSSTNPASARRLPSPRGIPAQGGVAAFRSVRSLKWVGLAVVAAAAVLAGCQSSGGSRTTDMLAGAGFAIKVADTADKQAALASLPARKVTMRKVKGKLVFLYADPAGCNCLYVGNETNYQTYQGMAFDRSVASQQLLAAEMANEADWSYGAWGPGWWM